MSDAAAVERFVEGFVAPLFSGRECVVADPLGVNGLEALRHGLRFSQTMDDVFERQLEEAALFSEVPPARFDEDTATLLYAVHELFAACHPQASSFYSRAYLYCQAAEQAVMKLARTYDASRLLSRHLVVRRAFQARRTDVHLKWWTGSASFYGTEPPDRLMKWPGLRRVDVDRKTQPMWRLAMLDGDEETRVARLSLMTALLNLSPLTRLYLLGDPAQKALGFTLLLPLKHKSRRMSPLYLLEDRRVARSVSDVLLERGVDTAGPMLALALLAAVRETSPPLVLRRAIELCVHLALSMCLGESENPGDKTAAPLRAFFDDDVKKLNDAARVYWSTVRAAFLLDGEALELPSSDALPPRAAPLWRRLQKRAEHPHLSPIAGPLARELLRRLPRLGQGQRVA